MFSGSEVISPKSLSIALRRCPAAANVLSHLMIILCAMKMGRGGVDKRLNQCHRTERRSSGKQKLLARGNETCRQAAKQNAPDSSELSGAFCSRDT